MTHPFRLTRRALAAVAPLLAGACQRASAKGAPSPDGPGCWSDMPPLPFAAQEIYPTLHLGRVHLAGGLLGGPTGVSGINAQHIAYNAGTGTSKVLAPPPGPRHHPQLVDHDGRLLQLGGFTGQDNRSWIMTADSYAYDDASDSWTPLAPAPGPHAECVAASLGGTIHLVGGRVPAGEANGTYGDHRDTDQHLTFDPASGAWTPAAPAPTARNSAAGAVINGLWHVVGGRTMKGPLDVHEVYDLKEDRWRAAAPMPEGSGAGGNAAAALGGKLFVFGGEMFSRFGGRVHAEVWRYDPATDAWTAVAPMPTPRHGLGAVAVGDSILTLGGAAKPSGVDTRAAVERFRTACA